MPYINPEFRHGLNPVPGKEGCIPRNVGQLTYVFYREAMRFFRGNSDSYDPRAQVVAALENAKLEFYRRHVAPYEDDKIAENGDVEG